VDVLEFALNHGAIDRHPSVELLPRLEEVAVIAETKLGDIDRALTVWRQMFELDPATSGRARLASASCRSPVVGRDGDHSGRGCSGQRAEARAEILRRLARLYLDKLNAPDRAAVVYREVLALDAKDAVALRAVVEAYERAEQWAELAALLRSQVEATSVDAEKVIFCGGCWSCTRSAWPTCRPLRGPQRRFSSWCPETGTLGSSREHLRTVERTSLGWSRCSSTTSATPPTRRRNWDWSGASLKILQTQIDDFDRAIPYWDNVLKHVPGTSRPCSVARGATKRQDDRGSGTHAGPADHRSGTDRRRRRDFCGRLARLAGDALSRPRGAQQAWQDLLQRYCPVIERAWKRSQPSPPRSPTDHTGRLAGAPDRAVDQSGRGRSHGARARPPAGREAEMIPAEAIRALEHTISDLDPAKRGGAPGLAPVAEARNDWPRWRAWRTAAQLRHRSQGTRGAGAGNRML